MLREVRAALAAAQETQATVQPAPTALIPKPHGTSGRRDFNLADKMEIDKKLCHQIQASFLFHPSIYSLTISTGFRPFSCEHVNPRQERVVEKPAWG
jgi:hypothetical protein